MSTIMVKVKCLLSRIRLMMVFTLSTQGDFLPNHCKSNFCSSSNCYSSSSNSTLLCKIILPTVTSSNKFHPLHSIDSLTRAIKLSPLCQALTYILWTCHHLVGFPPSLETKAKISPLQGTKARVCQ